MMAKRKTNNTKVATKEPAVRHDIEWVTIKVPRYTGPIERSPDSRIQTVLDTPQQRERWLRLHIALQKLAEQEVVDRQFAPKVQHVGATSLRWLIDALGAPK